ncbi:UNVERIFIED_CONTAM: hypothetical protein PYX00_004783 [Menopon gallinae]|uniref:ABC transporter G family member 20 n=1 Tax=Menopon gallinae TaxID=328185 RepID=A0AAW2I776_9NEOP
MAGTVEEMTELPRKVLHPQQSTIWTRKQHAVCVRRAVKRYGTKKCPTTILNDLNMTVPRGKIYGLLGASGCGKTTLLSCIVGRRRLNAGEIWVLGGKPGSRGSGVPGPRIGYMPQEIALYGEFSIKETLVYFGWISGMTTSEVKQKLEFLLKFLMLPPASRLVKNLSGGQQRRVSFAAAMLHDPELLILDEPTVGVDPVLRQSIWDHLVEITKDGSRTVIITTHYIEETRQAGMVGLMRGGRFLAEDSPENLMQQYNSETLEDVFLKLSVMQNMNKRRRSGFMQELIGVKEETTSEGPGDDCSEISGEFGDAIQDDKSVIGVVATEPLPPEVEPETTFCEHMKFLQKNHMKALIWKNFLWMWRNVGVMAFIVGLPVIEMIIFCLSIGHDPQGLKFAIVNNELNKNFTSCQEFYQADTGSPNEQLACLYLKHLKNRNVEFIDMLNETEAEEEVRRGHAWGSLQFPSNFSESLWERVELGNSATNSILDFSNIKVVMDMSNQQIGQLLNRDIFLAFVEFAKDIANRSDLMEKAALPPIRINEPVYGDKIPNFTDFAAPGVILTVIFFLSVASTSGAILMERNEGLLERSLVLGITGPEILFSHVITQFLIMVGQAFLVLIFTFAIFALTMRGNIITVLILVILTGVCGMAFGFVVSCSCENERNATYMALGSFLPIVMLCGIIWPIEGMHSSLQFISMFLPLTKSTESLRSMLQRGWDFSRPSVYYGFISTAGWIGLFMSISILTLKFKKG